MFTLACRLPGCVLPGMHACGTLMNLIVPRVRPILQWWYGPQKRWADAAEPIYSTGGHDAYALSIGWVGVCLRRDAKKTTVTSRGRWSDTKLIRYWAVEG